ncbi:hypothetical protein NDU88_002693 [Pleurodeles waltl]|uniref:CCHC-type domain-containing protein n=1 Tax=Pleurodeles waltl TaxID=8319 RepID=A0AAV7TLE2_PLEWA|nr:hypothetical protein NDU88_002693 [Pleurodeles waltl]
MARNRVNSSVCLMDFEKAQEGTLYEGTSSNTRRTISGRFLICRKSLMRNQYHLQEPMDSTTEYRPPEYQDSLIQDQIVRCAYDKRIREKLLVKHPNLEEAIRIAKGMEHATVWLKKMEEVPKEGEPRIITEIRKKDDPHIKVEWSKPTKNLETTKVNAEEKRKAQEWRVIKCYRCDAPGHIASSRTCAARNAICRSCGKRGHFAKVCRLRSNVGNKTIQEVQDVCETMEDIILTVNEKVFPDDYN